MSDRHDHPPAPVVAALVRAFPPLEVADSNDRYDHRLNGFPRGSPPPSRWYPLPVLDPDVGTDRAWRRLRFEVVRSP